MELWGWGKKNTANVNSKGQLLTFSEAFAPEYDAALVGEAFVMDVDGIQTDGASYWLVVIKNGHSTKDLVVEHFHAWVPSFSNTQIYEAVVGQTFEYASNGTLVVPTNRKSGVTGGAQGDFYVNDGTGNITTIGGTGLIISRHIFATTPLQWIFNVIVPPNQTFMIRSDLAEKLTGHIDFYYREE